MNIKDGLKLEGRPAEIPDCNRDDLPQFFVDMGYRVGVEIGVDKGEYTEKFCKAGLQMYGVDPWKWYPDYPHPKGQKRLDFLHEHTLRTLAPYDATIIRKTSMEAVEMFEDNSLDFVYIDGHHGFKYVTEDIYEWSKKIKVGGVISGHDYALNRHEVGSASVLQVRYVVDAYTKAFGIRQWYVLGRYKALPGEKRDRFRSWLWIKKA